MDSAITNLVQSVDWSQLIPLVSAALVFAITLSVQGFIKSLLALRKFKKSQYVGIGSVLRFPTATGSVTGEVLQADLEGVLVRTSDSHKLVPIQSFVNSGFEVVVQK